MKLDAIGIVASDMKLSVKFYQILGLEFSACSNDQEMKDHIEATTKSGLRLMLDSESLMKQLKPNWIKPQGQRMTLAFLCDSAAAVDKIYAEVLAAGFKGDTQPWDAFWGQRYASVLDPDGNSVDLFAPLDN